MLICWCNLSAGVFPGECASREWALVAGGTLGTWSGRLYFCPCLLFCLCFLAAMLWAPFPLPRFSAMISCLGVSQSYLKPWPQQISCFLSVECLVPAMTKWFRQSHFKTSSNIMCILDWRLCQADLEDHEYNKLKDRWRNINSCENILLWSEFQMPCS